MIMKRHGLTKVRCIEGLVNDIEQEVVVFPNDNLIDKKGNCKVSSPVKIYYIKPEIKEDK